MSSACRVTIVVVPRERFSLTRLSLDSIYKNSDIPFELVYVDGASPPPIRDYLAAESKKRNFRLIRTEYPLSPNEARNLGIQAVQTPYLVFVDNDLVVLENWLGPLVASAEREQAWLVGPTYLSGRIGERIVHMAGGNLGFVEVDGKRRFMDVHHRLEEPYDQVRDQLKPGPTEVIEFHCVLARRDVFDRIGLLDEQFMSMFEHADVSLLVREAKGLLYYEPRSVVNNIIPPPFDPTDLPYFLLRWSDEWTRTSVSRLVSKYAFDPEDPYPPHLLVFAMHHREIALRFLRWPLGKMAGFLKYRALPGPGGRLTRSLEDGMTAPLRELRRRHQIGNGATAPASPPNRPANPGATL